MSLILEKSTGACSEGIFSKTGSRREIILSKNIPPRNYPETGGPRLQFCSGNCWGDAKTVYFAYIYILLAIDFCVVATWGFFPKLEASIHLHKFFSKQNKVLMSTQDFMIPLRRNWPLKISCSDWMLSHSKRFTFSQGFTEDTSELRT